MAVARAGGGGAGGGVGGGGKSRRLPYDLEWRLPVGCDFSGFFVEVVLGYIPYLHERTPVHLLQGGCSEDFLNTKLAPRDAAVYRATQVEDVDRSAAQTRRSVAIEHAEPCKIRDFSADGRPLLVISRAMSEGNLAAQQATCIRKKGVDEVWVPTSFHVDAFVRAGVPRRMLRVVPESVDVDFFDPELLFLAELGRHQHQHAQQQLRQRQLGAANATSGGGRFNARVGVCDVVNGADVCGEHSVGAPSPPPAAAAAAAEAAAAPPPPNISDGDGGRLNALDALAASHVAKRQESALDQFMRRFHLRRRRTDAETPSRSGRGMHGAGPASSVAAGRAGANADSDKDGHRDGDKDRRGRRSVSSSSSSSTSSPSSMLSPRRRHGGVFRFVSVFKWEQRKGWDVLLAAYWRTFNPQDHPDVVLTLRTWKPPWERGPEKIATWLKSVALQSFGVGNLAKLARVELVEEEISRDEMRLLYAVSDAFVLPTRGEGWGLPAMEAMAMEVPAIITNYSGPATFVSADNGYPVRVAHLHRNGQAEPDVEDVQRLMRHVYDHPDDARRKGKRARQDVLRNYHPHMVAETVLQHVEAAMFLKYEH